MPPLAIDELGQRIARIPAPRINQMCHSGTDAGTEDDLIADMLISMWALQSGRFLRRGIRPDQLSEEELISFWADDLTPETGSCGPGQAA